MSSAPDPVRPSPGPLFPAALASWGAALAGEQLSWMHYIGTLPTWLAGAVAATVAASIAAAVLLHRRKAASLLPACAAFAAVLAVSLLMWHAWEAGTQTVSEAVGTGVVVEVTGDPATRDYGCVSEGRVRIGGHVWRLRLLWPDGEEPVAAGRCIDACGRLSIPSDTDGGRWSHRSGYVGVLALSEYADSGPSRSIGGLVGGLRASSLERLSSYGPDASALLKGVLLGNREDFSGTEVEQAFRACGLAHLMAVSGTHLAVVAALAAAVLGALPLARGARAASLVVLLLGYVALTGFAPSALRSLLMVASGLGAPLAARRRDPLNALGLCVIVFLGLDPALAFSTGYLLSVLSIAGLLVFSPLASAWVRASLPEAAHRPAEAAAATLAASLATFPVALPLFCQLPLISPLANLLAAPLVSIMLGLGVPSLLLIGPLSFAGDALIALAAAVANACAWLVRVLSALPCACLPLDIAALPLGIGTAAAAVALWAAWPLPGNRPRRRVRALAAAATLLPLILIASVGIGGVAVPLGPLARHGAEVVALDIGQGDAILIRDGPACALIDTGEEGDALLRALARNGVTHLHAVFITHKDADHCGALASLQGVVPVEHVYVHADLLGFEGEAGVLGAARRVTGAEAEGVRPGDTARLGRMAITLLAPERGGTSENDDSLIDLVSFDDDGDGIPEATMLATGDAEEEALRAVCPAIGHVDILKVGHHGSAGAFSREQLDSLSPQIALISVGAGNSYGHPTAQTLGLLEEAGAAIYRTDLCGDVSVRLAGTAASVKTQR